MKLRNKKTGEIKEFWKVVQEYDYSLAELVKEWEDYEDDKPWKPKEGESYWFIGNDGVVLVKERTEVRKCVYIGTGPTNWVYIHEMSNEEFYETIKKSQKKWKDKGYTMYAGGEK